MVQLLEGVVESVHGLQNQYSYNQSGIAQPNNLLAFQYFSLQKIVNQICPHVEIEHLVKDSDTYKTYQIFVIDKINKVFSLSEGK